MQRDVTTSLLSMHANGSGCVELAPTVAVLPSALFSRA